MEGGRRRRMDKHTHGTEDVSTMLNNTRTGVRGSCFVAGETARLGNVGKEPRAVRRREQSQLVTRADSGCAHVGPAAVV